MALQYLLSANILYHRCEFCKSIAIRNTLKVALQYYCSVPEEVVIPKRIHRGPTDILKALSSTVGRDPTAAHYKYHDDPYLIPTSNLTKRMYALSQESGKKAAMWIKKQHPQLFLHREADPPIKAYFPRAVWDEEDDVDNDILMSVINDAFVTDAITVYELMQKKNIEVTEESKQALLELLCFFNNTEDINEELIEERWFSQSSKTKKFLRKTWQDGGYAEKVFNEMKQTAKAYSAIIQGMCKFHQVDRAYDHYNAAKEKDLVLSLEAYNGLIRVIPFIKEGFPQRCETIESFLKTMNDNNIRPNVITLNAVLSAVTYLTGSYKEAKEYALKAIAEMKQFDVEPCLATYNLLLNLFCADRGPKSYILEDILNHIEGKEFKIYEKDDVLFFSTAMDRCRYHLQDKDLAYRVNKLLHTGTNYNFIGDSYKESVYYRNFFMLLCQTETIEELMDQYKYYVPHVYIPEISVMIEIVKTVTMNGANEYYPRLWSDIEKFQLTGREELLQTMLSGMILNRSPQLDVQPSDTAVKFAEIAWKIFELINSQNEMTRNRITWTGSMLGDIMTLCLFANEFEKATTIFDILSKYQQDILGSPSIEPFCVYIDYCIREKNVTAAMNCLQYVSEAGFSETENFCRKIVEHFNLSPLYKSRIAAMVGAHVFKESKDNDKTQEKHTATAN